MRPGCDVRRTRSSKRAAVSCLGWWMTTRIVRLNLRVSSLSSRMAVSVSVEESPDVGLRMHRGAKSSCGLRAWLWHEFGIAWLALTRQQR
eukprot:1242187-Prymnesium_polylepis.1